MRNIYDKAICLGSDIDFFSEDQEEIEIAKGICYNCPVRRQCLQNALDTQTRFGVWGGVDEKELRKVLSLDQFGKPVRRERAIACPYCKSNNLTTSDKNRTKMRLKCSHCGMEWWTRRTAKVIEVDTDEDVGDDF